MTEIPFSYPRDNAFLYFGKAKMYIPVDTTLNKGDITSVRGTTDCLRVLTIIATSRNHLSAQMEVQRIDTKFWNVVDRSSREMLYSPPRADEIVLCLGVLG